MIHQLHITTNGKYGIQYTFSEIGEGLPMHIHEPELFHDVNVVTGKIAFYTTNGANLIVVNMGQTINFDGTVPHEIVALESNTRIINIFLNGMPKDYDKLPPEELEWTQPQWKPLEVPFESISINNVDKQRNIK